MTATTECQFSLSNNFLSQILCIEFNQFPHLSLPNLNVMIDKLKQRKINDQFHLVSHVKYVFDLEKNSFDTILTVSILNINKSYHVTDLFPTVSLYEILNKFIDSCKNDTESKIELPEVDTYEISLSDFLTDKYQTSIEQYFSISYLAHFLHLHHLLRTTFFRIRNFLHNKINKTKLDDCFEFIKSSFDSIIENTHFYFDHHIFGHQNIEQVFLYCLSLGDVSLYQTILKTNSTYENENALTDAYKSSSFVSKVCFISSLITLSVNINSAYDLSSLDNDSRNYIVHLTPYPQMYIADIFDSEEFSPYNILGFLHVIIFYTLRHLASTILGNSYLSINHQLTDYDFSFPESKDEEEDSEGQPEEEDQYIPYTYTSIHPSFHEINQTKFIEHILSSYIRDFLFLTSQTQFVEQELLYMKNKSYTPHTICVSCYKKIYNNLDNSKYYRFVNSPRKCCSCSQYTSFYFILHSNPTLNKKVICSEHYPFSQDNIDTSNKSMTVNHLYVPTDSIKVTTFQINTTIPTMIDDDLPYE